MNLPDALAQVFFSRTAAPSQFELVLRNRGKELTAAGYERVKVGPKAWRVGTGEATVEARFGPFPAGADFDEAVILADGTQIHSEKMPGRIPPTGDFSWTPTVVVL